ncbi:MAG: response regulator [Thermoanaerobaculia bacterium]
MSDVKTALVIDDDDDIREVLRVMLESGGLQVDVLSDGIDAVDLKKWYDVILLDLKMPVFDGQRLTDYWQLTDPDILRRVIVLSGYSRLTMDQELPTFARLAKPFDYRTLMKVVDECIAQGHSLKSFGRNHV